MILKKDGVEISMSVSDIEFLVRAVSPALQLKSMTIQMTGDRNHEAIKFAEKMLDGSVIDFDLARKEDE